MLKILKYKITEETERGIKNNLYVLSREEIFRAERFKYKKDFLSYIAGKILIRKIISVITKVNPEEIGFKLNEHKKPFLQYPKINNLYFNISHSGKMIFFAISNKSVGVDIERIRPIDLDISSNIFHDKEIDFINKYPEKKIEKFFQVWTLKESFVKAVGKGLFYPLKSFYFDFSGNSPQIILTKKKQPEKFFLNYGFLEDEYVFSICSKIDVDKIKIKIISNLSKPFNI